MKEGQLRNAALLVAASVLIALPSFGAEPNRWHGSNGETVIWHNGKKSINLDRGDNAVDPPRKFNCKHLTGCMVIVSASILERRGSGSSTTCAYVDGYAGAPRCVGDPKGTESEFISEAHQHIHVSSGVHTVQTIVHMDYGTALMLGWAIDYTIYDKRN
jgi:hypothetical protein